jgi:CheY-like chemotaxis protein
MLVIAIKDTGIGIKPEDLSKLFSKFERIEEKRNRNIEGTGLGMSITKMLLDMMDSHLEVDSVYGEGSTFAFRVEQKVTNWAPLGDYTASYAQMLKSKKKYREKFTAPEAHILVADDNEMNLLVFKNLLKKTKIQIDTVMDGTKAVEAAMARQYDIIFLDHMMPHKDGIQALHELRQHPEGPNSETPALCLTANAISGAREQYIEAGFNDYLTKPIDADKLEETLIEYLPDDKVVKRMEGSAPEAEDKPQDAAGDLPKILLPLQEQPWIDLQNGIDNLGSVDDYLPILKIFYESLDDKAAEIEGFYANEDWHNYTIKVHALKSSARFIGALEFGEKAQLLENAGKAGDIAYIRKHHEAFMTEYRSFKAPLAEVFIVSAAEKPEADAEMMDAILEEIRLAAESMDIDQLESIFDEMEEYQIPQEQEELWQQLVKAARQYDYQKIVSILAK